MPLDTSSYSLALLRLDGRRWNELRRIHAQISTQAAADGSSYLEMGNTKIVCTVAGPSEGKRVGGAATSTDATLNVEISIAAFSGIDRQKRSRNDKRTAELQHTLTSSLSNVIHTHLYPHSSIAITLHVLALDGGLLAALINAATLALVDAGVPMSDYLVACTAGSTVNHGTTRTGPSQGAIPGLTSLLKDFDDPLLDLNGQEEQELPYLTIATLGGEDDKVAVCMAETRMQAEKLEEMLAVAVDGCKSVRKILDNVVRVHGRKMLEEG